MSDARAAEACPCGSGGTYDACCGALHRGEPAKSAEALMRSRYTAYVRGDADYILRTWHPRERPKSLTLGKDGIVWTSLTVHAHRVTGKNKAVVEFSAHYRGPDGRTAILGEKSRFLREDGAWLYLDGDAL